MASFKDSSQEKKLRVIMQEICKWGKRERRNVAISLKKANFHTKSVKKRKCYNTQWRKNEVK